MIELATERIAPELEEKLRKWLSQPEANTLRRVVGALCQIHQAEALTKALTADPGEKLDLLAQSEMREAARYHDFRVVLDSLASQPKNTPFHTAKLLPVTTNANTIRSETED